MMMRAQPQIAACPLATPRVIALLPPPLAQGCDPLQGAITRPSTRVIAACAASIAEQQEQQQEVIELSEWRERRIRRKVNRLQQSRLPAVQQAGENNGGHEETKETSQGVERPAAAADVSTSVKLEAHLRSFSNARDLMQFVLEEHKNPLEPAELVFVCNQLSKLCEPKTMPSKAWQETKLFLDIQFARYPNFLENLSAYEMLVVITALGKAKYEPKPEWLEGYFKSSMVHLPTYGPGYIYLMLRAVEQTGLQIWELKRIPGFKDWMHALLGVALAKVRAYRADELVRTLGVLSDLRWKPSNEFQADFGDALKQKLEYLDPPQLSAALQALESMYIQPDEQLVQALTRQLQWKLPMFDDRDLATTAQALKLIKRVNPGLISEFMVDVGQKVNTFSPMALGSLLGAFGELVLIGKMAICPHQLKPAGSPAQQNRSSPAPQSSAAGLPSSSASSHSSPEQVNHSSSNERGMAHVTDNANSSHSGKSHRQESQKGIKAGADQPQTDSAPPSNLSLKPPLQRPKLFNHQQPSEMDESTRQRFDALRPLSPEVVAAYNRSSPAYGSLLPVVGVARVHGKIPVESALPAASPAWLQLMETAVTARLPEMDLRQAALSLRGLAVMGHQMDPATLASFFQTSQPILKTARALTLLYLLQALAFAQYRPADKEQYLLFKSWHSELCRALTRRVFTQEQACDLIAALASLPVRPSNFVLTSVLSHTRRNRPTALKHASPRRLALLLTGLKRLNYKPDFGFIHAFAQGVKFHWAAIEPQEFAAIMSALPVLGPAPLAFDHLWMAEMLSMVQCQIDKFDGPNLAVLLAAVVALGCDPARKGPTGAGVPSVRWCELVFSRLEEQQHMLAAPHAANVLWAAAQLQQPPVFTSRSWSLPGRASTPASVTTPAVTATTAEKPTLNPSFLEFLILRVSAAPNTLNAGQLADVMWSLDVLQRPIPSQLLQAQATLQLAEQASKQEHAQVQQKLPTSLATLDRLQSGPQSHATDIDEVRLDEAGNDHTFVSMLSSTTKRNMLLTDKSRTWRANDRFETVVVEGGDNTLAGGMREQRVGVPV